MIDFVGPAIEGLLVVLLIVALLYGMRLEKKLKALRDTQAGFAEAVRMLDQAAARAENGLDTLRRTAEDAHDGLHTRIKAARDLKTELENLLARGERTAVNLNKPLPQVTPPERAASSRRLELAPASAKSRVVFTAPADEETPLVLTEQVGKAPRPHIPPSVSTAPSRRSAARNVDDDLFDTAPSGSGRNRRIFGVRS
jgi:hypothetical protein